MLPGAQAVKIQWSASVHHSLVHLTGDGLSAPASILSKTRFGALDHLGHLGSGFLKCRAGLETDFMVALEGFLSISNLVEAGN